MTSEASAHPAAPKPHVTMADIAHEAGVSQSTVSRVLNATASQIPISEPTRERVLAAARRLGYRPNPLARGLRGASTMLLGVIVRDIVDPFFSGAVEAVTTSAAARDTTSCSATPGRADEAILLRSVSRHATSTPSWCWATWATSRDSSKSSAATMCARGRALARSASHGLAMVSVDNAHGISEALILLASDIDVSPSSVATRSATSRSDGGLRGEDAGGGPDIPRIRPTRLERTCRAKQALTALVGLPVPPTTIVCSTDQLAIGVLHGASIRGLPS
jgi:DNA-binding LacI/PurR family transcriptional regulator